MDEVFDILSNCRRRYALYYLYDQPDDVATLEELADAVVRLQHASVDAEPMVSDADETELDPDERRRRTRLELQHTHVPKLEDLGVLELDQRSETVRYWTQPSLEEWLEHAKHKERL
ncbi:hypothetical protein C493_19973 [Natronolimnohabitans innermongolicus JCM 12255]|uniref:DUF7344 domain-containing protein n=2 Tax=Natronolimnohabitans innermongolicus TaxID=253107 RepID=L9WKH8_9EURY|nr:hypothetical protein C493_19973 [Natronolimnohabitans innermongolicus JCM 12255]